MIIPKGELTPLFKKISAKSGSFLIAGYLCYMKEANYLIRDALADTSTRKFLEKIPEFPTDVLSITISVPPPVQEYIIFEYSGARAIITEFFDGLNIKFDKNSRIAFLIEFEKSPHFIDFKMDIRLIITGNQTDNISKRIKKASSSEMLRSLGIVADIIELSDVSKPQLFELVRPYIPELSNGYDKDKLKIMNRLYQLNSEILVDKDYKIHYDDDN